MILLLPVLCVPVYVLVFYQPESTNVFTCLCFIIQTCCQQFRLVESRLESKICIIKFLTAMNCL